MNNIGIRYYTSNPIHDEDKLSDNEIGILDKTIQVSEIDENVLNFVDVVFTDSATISINDISTKQHCQKVIDLLEIIKNNLQR